MANALRVVMEAIVVALACLAPWPFGSIHPLAEAVLFAGVAVLALLWAARVLLEWRLTWAKCPLALCLIGLFLLGAAQLVALPPAVLGWLSPGTVRLREEMVPARPEVLPGGEATGRPESTLSLYPGGTRKEVARLLAVLLLFAVVRNNVASPAALRRLGVAVLVNGSLLAVFAVVQHFSSPPQTLYWTFPSQGIVFGPFICRNHFSFYLNLCVGLGVGLLASFLPAGRGRPGAAGSLAALVQDPRCLWVVAALAIMVSSVALSLSRGGTLALLGGGLVGILARRGGAGRAFAAASVLTVFLAFGLVVWFGLPRVEERLATVWQEDAEEQGRLPMWRAVVGGAKDFPVWGTGYGTFRHVEAMSRRPGDDPNVYYEHAHNDYLEALIEGGLLRLALSLAAVALVYRLGWRALRRYKGRPEAGLALGALVGLTTIFLHGGVDYGLHYPAIVFLTAVVAAHLAALGAAPAEGGDEAEVRLGGVAPLLGAAGCAALAWLLVGAGNRAAAADAYRLEALRAGREAGAAARQRQIAALEAATGRDPEDTLLRVALADAQREAFRELSGDADDEALGNRYLAPALRHYLRARDACPLLAAPHVQIAALRDRLQDGAPRRAYLARATRLRPSDAEMWYLAGAQAMLDGDQDLACASWRHSLECSEAFLGQIVRDASRALGTGAAASGAFPDNPDLLYRAAFVRDPAPDGGAARAPFFGRALALLEARGGGRPAKEFHLEALIRDALGQSEPALDAYRAALVRDPLQAGWRYEFARLLYRQGRSVEAERELRVVMREQPGNAEARDLLRAVLEGPAGG